MDASKEVRAWKTFARWLVDLSIMVKQLDHNVCTVSVGDLYLLSKSLDATPRKVTEVIACHQEQTYHGGMICIFVEWHYWHINDSGG